MELAEAVGVPRTTINDWLGRYAKYIDFQNVGRRRVYPESAVGVLRDISTLRNQGLAFQEIEAELAKNHAQRAEVAEPETGEKTSSSPNTVSDGAEDPSLRPEEFALIAKHQSDEIGKVIGDSFREMAGRLHNLENKAGRAERKLLAGYVFIFLLLVAIGLVLAALFRNMKTESVRQTRTGETVRLVEERTVSLTGSSEQMKESIQKLEKGLDIQKHEFDRAVRELKSSRDAEIRIMKEKFASERTALLKDLENLSKDKDQIIRELQEKLRNAEKEKENSKEKVK